MNVYLSASFSRRKEMNNKAEELRSRGYNVTARWLAESKSKTEVKSKSISAMRDIDDVLAADLMIIFTESSKEYWSGGRHTELGLALATLKEIIAIGGLLDEENVFYYYPGIVHYETWEDFLTDPANDRRELCLT